MVNLGRRPRKLWSSFSLWVRVECVEVTKGKSAEGGRDTWASAGAFDFLEGVEYKRAGRGRDWREYDTKVVSNLRADVLGIIL